jgi:hypothetical protein
MLRRFRGNARTLASLPFDPNRRDIVCRRDPAVESGVRCNIEQTVISHSPCGFEWGYGGSGPHDFALNILCKFIRPHEHTAACFVEGDDQAALCEDPDEACWWGSCPAKAWELHHDFCREFIATMPKEGGVITGSVIMEWLAARGVHNLIAPERPTPERRT